MLVVDACAGAGGEDPGAGGADGEQGAAGRACDRDGRRLVELKTRARRAGVHNYESRTRCRGRLRVRRASATCSGKADVVLIDAPCSGLGALRRNPDARWRLDEAEIDTFPPRQKEILERYAALVRPGGRLVYATCSINQRENEDVRAWFLSGHSEFEPIEPGELLGASGIAALESAAMLPLEGPKSGFKSGAPEEKPAAQPTTTGGRKPGAARRLDVQLLPERHGTDGFYIAGMRRKG